jgi:hypothetical protein
MCKYSVSGGNSRKASGRHHESQPGRKLAQCLAAMADRILFVGGEFRGTLAELVIEEHRIVAESACSQRRRQNPTAPFRLCDHGWLLAVRNNEGNGTVKACLPPVRRQVPQLFEQFFNVILITRIVAGVSCGPYTRAAAERINGQA